MRGLTPTRGARSAERRGARAARVEARRDAWTGCRRRAGSPRGRRMTARPRATPRSLVTSTRRCDQRRPEGTRAPERRCSNCRQGAWCRDGPGPGNHGRAYVASSAPRVPRMIRSGGQAPAPGRHTTEEHHACAVDSCTTCASASAPRQRRKRRRGSLSRGARADYSALPHKFTLLPRFLSRCERCRPTGRAAAGAHHRQRHQGVRPDV